MARIKQITEPQLAIMFGEFGLDLRQWMANVQSSQHAVVKFKELQAECKKRFRVKAFDLHPDRNGGDDTEFKRINEIFQTIEKIQPFVPPPRPSITIQVTNFGGGQFTSTSTSTTSSVTGNTWTTGGW